MYKLIGLNTKKQKHAFLGSGINKMNEFYKQINPSTDRRIASRYRINLKSSVLITAIQISADGEESYLILQGQLRDVSVTGLALTISYDDMQELTVFGEDSLLRLLLPLPNQAIELEAFPVRYEWLDNSETNEVLVGAQITNMKGRDRVIFMDFILENELAQTSEQELVAG